METNSALSEQLVQYLRAQLADPSIGLGSPLERLPGGYDTFMYRFSLDRQLMDLPQSLVLRVYPRDHGREKPLMESTVQNVLAAAGHPTARVFFVSTDASLLGGRFIIMEHLPGRPLINAPSEIAATVLGDAQAELHDVDPQPLIEVLQERELDNYRLSNRFEWLNDRASELPAIREGVGWFRRNLPATPEPPTICHGDFHLLNLLFDGKTVTGLVDWSAFTLADPLFDIAGTLMLFSINGRRLSEAGELSLGDVDLMIGKYLAAYRSRRALDDTNLEYYRALRCMIVLVRRFQAPDLRTPAIEEDLAAQIRATTGIRVSRV